MMNPFDFIGALIPTAQAQDLWGLWSPPCSPLQPGCGGGPANIFENTLPNLAIFMLQIATGLAVFYIIWAGFHMILSRGDEGNIGQQKTAIFYAVAGLFLAIASQLLVSFVATHDFGQAATGNLPIFVMASVVNFLLATLNGILVIIIIYYGARMLMASGDSGQYGTAKTALTWAILGAIIVNLSNALVQGVTSFFAV